jgi:hypothetical protein
MSSIQYKEYIIEAIPLQLRDSGEWTTDIRIRRFRLDKLHYRAFSAGNTFKTEEEAIQRCIDFGKRIIDGEIKNCTVTDL